MKRILVVDDEAAFLLAVKKVFGRAGVGVDTATTAEEAENLLEHEEYDGVIADLSLSGSTGEEGLEIARLVKSRRPNARVLVITAYGSPEIEEKIRELGVDGYFEKPVPIRVLRKALDGGGVSGE